MTIHELNSKLAVLMMQDPFTRDTYLNPHFAGNYTGTVRSNHFGKGYYLLDSTFDPNDFEVVEPGDLLQDLDLEDSKGAVGQTTDVAFYVPSMGTYPVLDIRRKKGDWGDGDGPYDYIELICSDEPVADNLTESVENYIHPILKACAEYVPTVYYACYTLDNKGNEEDHFDDFDLFEDAVSACKQKTNESHQSTHICVVITDGYTDESYAFERSYGLSNYEVVAEFSPDPGEGLIEKSFTWYKRRNRDEDPFLLDKFMANGYRNK